MDRIHLFETQFSGTYCSVCLLNYCSNLSKFCQRSVSIADGIWKVGPRTAIQTALCKFIFQITEYLKDFWIFHRFFFQSNFGWFRRNCISIVFNPQCDVILLINKAGDSSDKFFLRLHWCPARASS